MLRWFSKVAAGSGVPLCGAQYTSLLFGAHFVHGRWKVVTGSLSSPDSMTILIFEHFTYQFGSKPCIKGMMNSPSQEPDQKVVVRHAKNSSIKRIREVKVLVDFTNDG